MTYGSEAVARANWPAFEVRVTAGLGEQDLPAQDVEIRGRGEPMTVRAVADAKALAPLVEGLGAAAA